MSARTPARARRWAAAVAAAGVLAVVLLSAEPASAHDYLVGSTPAAGATVTAPPASVSLTFDAGVLDFGRGSDGVVVLGPGGAARHFETRCATVSGDTVTAPVALGVGGRYTVRWRIVSADGHPVTDEIAFTYRPAAGAAVAAGSAAGPDCGVTVGRPAGSSGAGTGLALLVVGVAVGLAALVAVALVIAVVVLRRGRPPADPDEDEAPGA